MSVGKNPEQAIYLLLLIILSSCSGNLSQTVLFEDEFDHLPIGYLSSESGPLTEFYYLPEAGQKGNWTITSFGKEEGYQTAWEIVEEGETVFLRQNYSNLDSEMRPLKRHTHSSIIAGDSLWSNYSLRFTFVPHEILDKCGIMFRYQNDRCYYFFGMEGNMLMLKLVQHATAPYRPYEKVLASRKIHWKPGEKYECVVTLRDNRIYAQVNDTINLVASDNTFGKGKIGLLSDVKADFYDVRVSTLKFEKRRLNRYRHEQANQTAMRLNENPVAVLLNSISTGNFGTGNNLRFGDLNGDGEDDILFVQHKKGGIEPACITALNFSGDMLWQKGKPNSEDQLTTYDLPIQIHDIDGDGAKEVVYVVGNRIIVLEGKSGKQIKKGSLPGSIVLKGITGKRAGMRIFFCDLQGKGRDSDMIVVEQKGGVYAFNERLRPIWSQEIESVSYPSAYDIDKDGKDELVIGYTLIDDDGAVLWDNNNIIKGEADGLAIASFENPADSSLKIVYGAGDWGMMVLDISGNIIVHNLLGYVQSPSIANFRNDLPGLEMVSCNFWGSQGTIHFYNAKGEKYHSFEPGPFGSRCLPVNWKGDGEEYFLLNASSGDGGLFNGKGQLVVVFPDDGHPDLCSTVIDVSGDSRDEIICWDQEQIWIYTQSDNPRRGELYCPLRNPAYNYSNFQSTVSVPDWN